MKAFPALLLLLLAFDQLWAQPKLVIPSNQSKVITSMTTSPKGNFLIHTVVKDIFNEEFTNRIFNMKSGDIVYEGNCLLPIQFNSIETVAILADGKKLKLLDMSSGQFSALFDLQTESEDTVGILWAHYSPDGKFLITGTPRAVYLWSLPLSTTKPLQNALGSASPAALKWSHPGNIDKYVFSDDGKFIAWTKINRIEIVETESGKIIRSYKGNPYKLLLSPSGKFLLADNGTTDLNVELIQKRQLDKLKHENRFAKLPFSIFDNTSGQKKLVDLKGRVNSFSPDEKYLIISRYHEIEIWDLEKNKSSAFFKNFITPIFSNDGQLLFLSGPQGIVSVKTGTWQEVKSFAYDGFSLLNIVEQGKVIMRNQSQVAVLDINKGENILTLTLTDTVNWVVTHPSGLFDASPSGRDKLYFVQGVDTIDFNQLKDRYYEPGLWRKVMAGEQLRNVAVHDR